MNFKHVDISDRQQYETYFLSNNYINDNYIASELNFANLYCWNVSENIELCFENEAVYVKASYPDGHIFLPPLVKNIDDFYPCITKVEKYCEDNNIEFSMRSLTKEMVEVLNRYPHNYEIEHNRDYSEYLYSTEDLITLVGKKFNQKRNHLNYFNNNIKYVFREYTQKDKQDIINLVFEWKIASGSVEILEQIAIDSALAYFDELSLRCLVIEVDEKIIAFAIGFINRNNCGIVMFEKADANYRGSYPAINNLFAKEVFSNTKLINRQEDMGIEGLRKAKESYNPVGMVDKFDLTIKKN